MINNNQNISNKGFTLIEVLVSLTLFLVVVTVSISSLLAILDANLKVQNMQNVMTNLSFAMDSMSRQIRTGDMYYCESGSLAENEDQTNDCLGGGAYLYFNEGGRNLTRDSSSRRIGYRFDDDTNNIERRIVDNGHDWQPLLSDEVEIGFMRFYVTGTDRLLGSGDTLSPTVTIVIEGEITDLRDRGLDADFKLQTTVTQQVLDL